MKAHDLVKALRPEIEEISDAEDRSIAECMLVVISAAKVGADVDRLVEHTGYRRGVANAHKCSGSRTRSVGHKNSQRSLERIDQNACHRSMSELAY
jgi:hypothetical protein